MRAVYMPRSREKKRQRTDLIIGKRVLVTHSYGFFSLSMSHGSVLISLHYSQTDIFAMKGDYWL